MATLKHLALRYNPTYGGGWPSNQEIAGSCSICLTTVKLALRRLEHEFKLIRRASRGSGRSKLKDILWDKLIANQAAILAAVRQEAEEEEACLPSVDLTDDDQAVLDGLDSPREPTADVYARQGEIVATVQGTFAGHVTLTDKGSDRMMAKCVRACIDVAGSGDVCFDVVKWICTDPDQEKTRSSVRASDRLAGYITYCFTGWLKQYKKLGTTPNYKAILESVCINKQGLQAPDAKLPVLVVACSWIQETAGRHLLSMVQHPEGGMTSVSFTFSEAYRAALILGRHSGQEVVPQYFEGSHIENVDDLCEWAVRNDRWGALLKLAPEVHDFFLTHRDEILHDRATENNLRTEEEAHV